MHAKRSGNRTSPPEGRGEGRWAGLRGERKEEREADTGGGGSDTAAARAAHERNLAGSVGVCAGDRDLHGERAPAKIFINLSRKHVLKNEK